MEDRPRARPLEAYLGEWVAEGLLEPAQADAIRGRLPPQAEVVVPGAKATPGGTGWVARFLYTTAGLLAGAAVLAFIFVALEITDPALPLFLIGLVLAAGGLALALAGQKDLAHWSDTLFVAALVPLTAGAIVGSVDGGYAALPYLGSLIALGLIVWRWHAPEMRVVAILAAHGMLFATGVADFQLQATVWLVGAIAVLAAVLLTDRYLVRDSPIGPAFVATGALLIAFIPFLMEDAGVDGSMMVEVLVGIAAVALIGGGVLLQHRGVVAAGVAALGLDAIVFAFDIGNVFTGTITLLVLAAVFLVFAIRMRGTRDD